MKKIIIWGGKGNGTVVLNTIIDINNLSATKQYEVIGFVNNKHKETVSIEGIPVLGDIDIINELVDKHDAYFLNAISSVNTMNIVKNTIDKILINESNRLINIIHPSAIIGNNVKLGNGCFIGHQSYIGQNAIIEDNCFIHAQCYVARDSIIKKHTYLAPKAYVGAEAIIENSVYIGVGALIKERVHINEFSIIGMGSIIVEDIPEKSKYYGEKAKKR
ncbi:MAG: hypothetical protein JXR58_08385 [Bacteroidales bacterium]|nr:hypothetical protein [Bacteroidales bacterium]